MEFFDATKPSPTYTWRLFQGITVNHPVDRKTLVNLLERQQKQGVSLYRNPHQALDAVLSEDKSKTKKALIFRYAPTYIFEALKRNHYNVDLCGSDVEDLPQEKINQYSLLYVSNPNVVDSFWLPQGSFDTLMDRFEKNPDAKILVDESTLEVFLDQDVDFVGSYRNRNPHKNVYRIGSFKHMCHDELSWISSQVKLNEEHFDIEPEHYRLVSLMQGKRFPLWQRRRFIMKNNLRHLADILRPCFLGGKAKVATWPIPLSTSLLVDISNLPGGEDDKRWAAKLEADKQLRVTPGSLVGAPGSIVVSTVFGYRQLFPIFRRLQETFQESSQENLRSLSEKQL